MSLSRRGLFAVLAGAVAAPYVARAGVLMPVRTIASTEPVVLAADGMNWMYTGDGWYRVWMESGNAFASIYARPNVMDGKIVLPNLLMPEGGGMAVDFAHAPGGAVRIMEGETYEWHAPQVERRQEPAPYIATKSAMARPQRPDRRKRGWA